MAQLQTPPPTLGLSEALVAMEEEKTELDKVIELMLKPENIYHLTELSRNEINAFSVLLGQFKAHPELKMLGAYLRENLTLRVSKGRKGRLETVKIVSRQMQMDAANMETPRTGMSRWFGRRR